MELKFEPIGTIYSPFTDKNDMPIQSARSQAIGRVEINPRYSEGLKDIAGFSHLILLYVFHESKGYELHIKPFLDDNLRGLFATRYPYRPNPIGLSVVHLLKHEGNILEIEDVDVLNGTPLLDIKPYVEDFDVRLNTRQGWYETRSKK